MGSDDDIQFGGGPTTVRPGSRQARASGGVAPAPPAFRATRAATASAPNAFISAVPTYRAAPPQTPPVRTNGPPSPRDGWAEAGRELAYDAADGAGAVYGAGRGVVHAVQGAYDGAHFLTRLLDPREMTASPSSAWGEVIDGGKAALDYGRRAIADPAIVVDDGRKALHRLHVSVDPSASPASDTFGDELKRRFGIGANQGELAFDVGTLAFGGGGLAAKGLRALGEADRIGNVERFIAQGYSRRAAEYLAQASTATVGHHFFPQRFIKVLGVPARIANSSFNVYKPTNMSRGAFYEMHYRVDPKVGGFGMPRRITGGGKGSGWSPKRAGLQKYGLAGRLLYGSPAQLNGAYLAAGAAATPEYQGDQP